MARSVKELCTDTFPVEYSHTIFNATVEISPCLKSEKHPAGRLLLLPMAVEITPMIMETAISSTKSLLIISNVLLVTVHTAQQT